MLTCVVFHATVGEIICQRLRAAVSPAGIVFVSGRSAANPVRSNAVVSLSVICRKNIKLEKGNFV